MRGTKGGNLDFLRLVHQNVQGIMPKLTQVEVMVDLLSPQILCLSEHFLRESDMDVFVLYGFRVVSSYCRSIRGRGGVCILVQEGLKQCHAVDVARFCTEGSCELACITVESSGSKFLVLSVYRPPLADRSNIDLFFNSLTDCLDSILKSSFKVVVAGDFNIDMGSANETATRLSHLMTSFGLRDTIKSYTREFNGSTSLIDNIFTNLNPSELVSQVVITAVSDHHAQVGDLKVNLSHMTNTPKFKLKRHITINSIHMLNALLVKEMWADIFSAQDVNSKFLLFLSTFSYHLDIIAPIKKVKYKEAKSFTKVVFDKDLLQLQEKVLTMYSLTKHLGSEHPLRKSYRDLKKQFRTKVHSAKSGLVLKHITRAQNKNRAVWDIIKDIQPNKKGKSFTSHSLGSGSGPLVVDPAAVACQFNTFFSQTGERLGSGSFGVDNPQRVCHAARTVVPSLFLWPTDAREVIAVVNSLRPGHSSGNDGVSSSLLKSVSEQLALPLAHIANASFESGVFPSVLRQAVVKPLLKKGSPHDIENYRPISILSTFSKVLEKLYLIRLLPFLSQNNIIFDKQYGFRRGYSTIDAVFDFINNVSLALDERQHSFGVFLDLRKAFDVVDHELLLCKLHNLGIRGIAFDWLSSFLSGRSQVVEIPFVDKSGCLSHRVSSVEKVKTGVPQGSVLGPVLFLLFVNDISSSVSGGNLCLFADDTSINMSHQNRDILEYNIFVQGSCLLQWLEENHLTVNTAKTTFLDFNIRAPVDGASGSSSILLGDSVINSSESTNFLGMTLDSSLNFHLHMGKVCGKLCSGIFLLRRLSSFANTDILLACYYGCIYPHLAYGLPIWGSENSRTLYIFRLQKKCLRIVLGLARNQSCRGFFCSNNILTFPSLYILETLTFVRKNMHIFTSDLTKNYNLRKSFRLPIPRHRTSFFENQLFYSSIQLFNHLPLELRTETEVRKFRLRLKCFLIDNEFYSVRDYLMFKKD